VSVLRQFHDYVKPEDGVMAQARPSVSTASATSADSDDGVATASSSLGDNVLTFNLGIPVVVVLTKVCAVSSASVLVFVCWLFYESFIMNVALIL